MSLWTRPRAFAQLAVLALSALTSACASRGLPYRFPPSTAASPAAPEAPPADVTRSLGDEFAPAVTPDTEPEQSHVHHHGGHDVP